MKAAKIIKALILIHIWSVIIAAGAWCLQRDTGKKIGMNFPNPRVWLCLIGLSFLPIISSIIVSVLPFEAPVSVPNIEVFEGVSHPTFSAPIKASVSLDYLSLYMGLSSLFLIRTIWQWSRLQRLTLTPTNETDVFTTLRDVPPLTLSWPRRAIVVPHGLESQQALICHERAHLRNHDAEVTLGLLLLRGILLRNPGISYLIRQWRLAIELRADKAVMQALTPRERKDYAALLLNGLRPSGTHKHKENLPCPTAYITSQHHRSVKMRLIKILGNTPTPPKQRWNSALLIIAICAGGLGLVSTEVAAKDEIISLSADKVIEVTTAAQKISNTCSNIDINDIEIIGKMVSIDGIEKQQHIATLETVILKYDIGDNRTGYSL